MYTLRGKMMLKLKFIRRTHYLAIEDTQAIATIKDKYGCNTDSDCVRLALRLTAQSPIAQIAAKKIRAQ